MLATFYNTPAELKLAGLLLLLLIACVAGLAFVLWVRKWVKDEAPPSRQDVGFTLSDLRQLHKSGKISNEEFERAREKIVGHARRNMPIAPARRGNGLAGPPASPPPAGPDATGDGESAQ